jgi:hypothetical protein
MTQPRRRRHRSNARISLRAALADPALLGNTLHGESWKPWRVLLIAAMGERLTDDERVLFKQLTGREHEPGQRVEELVGVIGRRGGKSRAISVLASYISGLCEHPNLVPGERGVCLIIAPDQNQADICLNYITANFEQSPILRQLIEQRTQRALKLTNRIDIEVRASDFRRLRGPTYIAVVADESAFWLTSEISSNPDAEILAAVRPGLATTGGPLFVISSPYARKGELWRLYQQHYGAHGDPLILVAQADSKTMNPSLPQSVVDRAYERDPASAAAEYGAEFRRDIESFVSIEAVRSCVSANVFERAPVPGRSYKAFCDPSGGSADSFTVGIGHYTARSQTITIDCLREWKPPFSPEQVVEDISKLLKSYRLQQVQADKYAGQWVVEQFAKFGIRCDQAAKPKSDLYCDLLALINSRRIELLDHPRAFNQITALERRTARSGRDQIDHPPGSNSHDDLSNAIAGVASLLLSKASYNWDAMAGLDFDHDPLPIDAYRRRRLQEREEAREYWTGLGQQIANYSAGKFWPR